MKNPIFSRCSGLSLIELLVALALSLILISGVVTLFLSSKRSYSETDRYSWIQENARFASLLLSKDLRMSQFLGQAGAASSLIPYKLSAVSSDCSGNAAAYTTEVPVATAVVATDGKALGCITDGVAGTSVLVIKHAKSTPVTPGSEEGTKTYVIANNAVTILYDGADGMPSTSVIGAGDGDFNAWEYQVHVYYIRQATKCSGYDAQNHNTSCLARKALRWDGATSSMTMTTEDVVDGVEAMSLDFGQDPDSDGSIKTFTNASTAKGWSMTQWSFVKAVRFSLLLIEEKPDPYYDATARTYTIGGTTFTPPTGDQYHRSVTQTTVLLRNPELIIGG